MATDTELLMVRARLVHLLACGFAYPDEALCQTLASGEYALELSSLGETLGLHSTLPALLAALGKERGAEPARLQGEHTYLFARNVLCPPYETSYGRGRGLGAVQDLAEVASFYAAFGFQVAATAKELPDHLCVELEFLAALYAKEAYAREQGWRERGQVCAEARAKFAAEHLKTWLPKFSERAREHARLAFYPALAALAETLVALEAAPALPAKSAAE